MRVLKEIRGYIGNYHVKSAIYHFYRGELKPAARCLRKAFEDEENLTAGDLRHARSYQTQVLKELAAEHEARGEVDLGLELLEQISREHPGYPDIHYERGRLLQRLGRSADAIPAYRAAIERYPSYLDAHIALGFCLLEAGQSEEAQASFQDALHHKLERIRAPFEDGRARLAAGETDEAKELFETAFFAVPQLAEEYRKKAVDWLAAGEYEDALVEFERAIALNPKYPDLHNSRGIVLCELERYDEAVDAFQRSSTLLPAHLVPRLNLAFAYVRGGQLREAEGIFEGILAEEPTEPVARAKLAEMRGESVPQREGA